MSRWTFTAGVTLPILLNLLIIFITAGVMGDVVTFRTLVISMGFIQFLYGVPAIMIARRKGRSWMGFLYGISTGLMAYIVIIFLF